MENLPVAFEEQLLVCLGFRLEGSGDTQHLLPTLMTIARRGDLHTIAELFGYGFVSNIQSVRARPMVWNGELSTFPAIPRDSGNARALKDIDVAFVCMNLPYTMPPGEAADAVKAFHPKIVYPYHYQGSDLKVSESALQGTGIQVRIRGWYAK